MASSKLPGAGLQGLVFALVAAAFTNVYITQPVLPVLEREFGVSASRASLTVAAVVFGMALANLPFGAMADSLPIRGLILSGTLIVAGSGLLGAWTTSFWPLVAARWLQGLFIPALTTCLAAYLSRNLPPARLNVVMGSYVAATVAGGLGGRLLGGWLHTTLNWRSALVTAALSLLAIGGVAVWRLPAGQPPRQAAVSRVDFASLLSQGSILRLLLVPWGAFFVFSSLFNYLPFYLARPPFEAPTEVITMSYLTYLTGIGVGPLAGRLSNRIGNGRAMILGTLILQVAMFLTLVPSLLVIVLALIGVCLGFFTIHAAAVGALNLRLQGGRGRANSLYVLFYYLGGSCGITATGWIYHYWGWPGVLILGAIILGLPGGIGWLEWRR